MNEIHPWWKVVDDISQRFQLKAGKREKLENQIVTALFSKAICPRDKYGEKLERSLQLTRDEFCVWVNAEDVNNYFGDIDSRYLWRPRKKQGAPIKVNSIEAISKTGQLETDAKQAAQSFQKRIGRPPTRDEIAKELNNIAPYKDFEKSYLVSHLRARWWK